MKDKRNLAQEAQTSSAMGDQVDFKFSELVTEDKKHPKASVIIKLTDESSAAIHEAVQKRQKLRMQYSRDACIVEIADPDSPAFKRFSCVVQPLGQPVDGIYYDAANQRYQTISAVDTRIQVKATEKTFAETREKTQKLIEEQQKRKTMDMTQQHTKHSSKHRPAPTSFKKVGSSSNVFSQIRTGDQHRKPAHGVSLRPSNTLAPGSCANAKPAATKQWEHAAPVNPMPRVEHKVPPTPKPVEPKVTLEPNRTSATVPAIRTSPNNAQKKRYFVEDSSHMTARKKRNDSGSSSLASASGSSSTEVSPPDFYQKVLANQAKNTFPPSSLEHKSDYNIHAPNGSLTLPTKPTKDWARVYGEIESLYDAKKYHEIFSTEYPEYFECYKTLSAVANEFHELERALKATQIGTPNHNKMEEAIQCKFAKYQQDQEFLNRRQKHADLRCKLDVLKQRIASWENSRPTDNEEDKRKKVPPSKNNYNFSDMMVM